MKKFSKRFLSIVLCVVLIASLLTAGFNTFAAAPADSEADYYDVNGKGINATLVQFPYHLKPLDEPGNLDFEDGYRYWAGGVNKGTYAKDAFDIVTEGGNSYAKIPSSGYVSNFQSALIKLSGVTAGDKLVIIYDVKGERGAELRVKAVQEFVKANAVFDETTGLVTTMNADGYGLMNVTPGTPHVLVGTFIQSTEFAAQLGDAGWTTVVTGTDNPLITPIGSPADNSTADPIANEYYIQLTVTLGDAGVVAGDKVDAAIDNIRIAKVTATPEGDKVYTNVATGEVIYDPANPPAPPTSDDGDSSGIAPPPSEEKTISFVSVANSPDKQKYVQGESLDLTGGKLMVAYTDGTYNTIDITSNMVSGYDSNKIGYQILTVTYGEFTAEFIVEVIDEQISYIAVSSQPTKKEYNKGESLDLTGGKIAIAYSDGGYELLDITADMVTGYDAQNTGYQTLTVQYKDYTTNLVVFVLDDIELSADTLVWLTNLILTNQTDNLEGDFNDDGVVNLLDIVRLKKLLAGSLINTTELANKNYGGKDFKMYYWYQYDDSVDRKIAAFNKAHNANVSTVIGTDFEEDIAKSIASGAPYDIVANHSDFFPRSVISNLFEPLDAHLGNELDYFNSSNPQNGGLLNSIVDAFTWNNKKYAVGSANSIYSMVFYYNKKAFSDSDLEDPYYLWKNGKWTWDTCVEMSNKVSNVENEVAFVEEIPINNWLTLNGCSAVKVDGMTATENLGDAKVLAAITTWKNLYTGEKPMCMPVCSGMFNGSVYATISYTDVYGSYADMALNSSAFDYNASNLGVVPMPTGLIEEGKYAGHVPQGYSAAKGAKDTSVAACYALFESRITGKELASTNSMPYEVLDYVNTAVATNGYLGFSGWKASNGVSPNTYLKEFGEEIKYGADITSTIAATRPLITKCIADTLSRIQ